MRLDDRQGWRANDKRMGKQKGGIFFTHYLYIGV
jgi:hypothetical protein